MKYQPIIRLLDPFIELFTQSPYSPQSTWIARIVISCLVCLLIIAFIRAFCDFEKWYSRPSKKIIGKPWCKECHGTGTQRSNLPWAPLCLDCNGSGYEPTNKNQAAETPYTERQLEKQPAEKSGINQAFSQRQQPGLNQSRPKGNNGLDCDCDQCVRYYGPTRH